MISTLSYVTYAIIGALIGALVGGIVSIIFKSRKK